MTKTNIFIRLALICAGFLAVGVGASFAFAPFIEDTITLMMIIKWVTVVYVIGLVYWFKVSSEIGLTSKSNWKSLVLYWPIALIALLSMSGGWNSNEVSLIIQIALLAIAVAITEEVIFRGFFFHYLRKLTPGLIVLISSLAFGGMHLAGLFANIPVDVVLAQAYAAAGWGMVVGNAKARYAGLAIPIFAHAVFDFAALGARGSVEALLVYDPNITFGMLFAGTIFWGWGIWLLFIGKRRNSFLKLSSES